LKKEKKSSRQSNQEKVLVPLLSKRESNPLFIEKISSEAGGIVLLLVIDTKAMAGDFGFATGEIAVGNALMQKMKAALAKKKKECNDIIEWGDTSTKIEHLAQLHQVKKICLVKQGNHFYETLVKALKEKLEGVEVEETALPEE
jgi:hypothetical protein